MKMSHWSERPNERACLPLNQQPHAVDPFQWAETVTNLSNPLNKEAIRGLVRLVPVIAHAHLGK